MRGIEFNIYEVRALKDGGKSIARKSPFQVPEGFSPDGGIYRDEWRRLCFPFLNEDGDEVIVTCPYKIGEVLFIKEDWALYRGKETLYRADYPDIARKFERDGKRRTLPNWNPAKTMKEPYARFYIRVTGVKTERLQDISDEELIADFGLSKGDIDLLGRDHMARIAWNDMLLGKEIPKIGWDMNPWTWAVRFEQVYRMEKEA